MKDIAFLASFLVLAFLVTPPALAQPVEGQPCSTAKNAYDNTAGGHFTQFTCDTGGIWRRMITVDADTPTTAGSYVGIGTETPQTRLDVAGPMKLGSTGESCVADIKGAMRWNDTDALIEYCDGVQWKLMVAVSSDGGVASAPMTGDGYFVITNGTWDGDLVTAAGLGSSNGGEAGNKLCYDDLTANDWMGKADATTRGLLTQENVQAFICTRGTCFADALASVTYYFAVSGDAAKGGASFTANASGAGPGDTNSWSGPTYFDGTKTYWTGRAAVSSDYWAFNDAMWAFPCASGFALAFDDNDPAKTGGTGTSNASNADRWSNLAGTCDVARHLICLVHPR